MNTRFLGFVGSWRAIAASILVVAVLVGLAGQSFRNVQVELERLQRLNAEMNLARQFDIATALSRLKVRIARAGIQETRDVRRGLRESTAELTEVVTMFDQHLSRMAAKDFAFFDGPSSRLLVTGQEVRALLGGIVALGDATLEGEDRRLTDRLGVIDRAAGRAAVRHQDYVRGIERFKIDTMERNARLLTMQSGLHAAILGVVLIIGVASLAVLRREVISREARAEAEEKANYLAFFDPLTELPNRTRFQQFGENLLAERRSVALILIDIDNFKQINDRFGHGMGDAVLREIAQRLQNEAEENKGMAARLGGDEFAVFLPSDNPAFLRRLCETLLDFLSDPVDHNGHSVMPSASIGVATASQMSAGAPSDLDHLTRFADFALYASKQEGRARFTFYDSELDRRFSERREMLDELPQAIRQGGLDIFLQPKVHTKTCATYGFEALVRWTRRNRLVLPDDFIEIAEQGGHIKALDLRVLHDATRIVGQWNADHGTDFTLSVNISAVHLIEDEDTQQLVRAVEAAPLRPEALTLEITETVQLADWTRVGRAIETLRKTGCRIAIDDFGTGYSSLAYLRTIPADELKIDKSLVAEVDISSESQFILDAVIDLARSLSLDIVVEGIERQSQLAHIIDMGCRFGQGYLFGRPEPAVVALNRALSIGPAAGPPPSALQGEAHWDGVEHDDAAPHLFGTAAHRV